MLMSRSEVLKVFCAAALLAMPLSAKMKVQSQHQAGNDCKQYKTYQWLPVKTVGKTGIIENDEAVAPVIKEAVNRELQAKGMKEVASGGELEVATAAMKETTPHTDALIFAWFPDYYTGTYWSSGQPVMALTSYSTQGAFIVNLIDTKTKKSAWVALAKDTVDKKQGKDKINKAAEKMFSDFPPAKP